MKKIVLTLILIGGFWALSSAQTTNTSVKSSKPEVSEKVEAKSAKPASSEKKETKAKGCCSPSAKKEACDHKSSSSSSCCHKPSATKED